MLLQKLLRNLLADTLMTFIMIIQTLINLDVFMVVLLLMLFWKSCMNCLLLLIVHKTLLEFCLLTSVKLLMLLTKTSRYVRDFVPHLSYLVYLLAQIYHGTITYVVTYILRKVAKRMYCINYLFRAGVSTLCVSIPLFLNMHVLFGILVWPKNCRKTLNVYKNCAVLHP